MPSFLLELCSEEIPARMQETAALALFNGFVQAFRDANMPFGQPKTFVTPRRLAFFCPDLPQAQPDRTIEKKGPKTGTPQAALDGFLRSGGLALEQLEKRMLGKDETYFAVIHEKGRQAADLLKTVAEKILADFPWPKSMRWGSGETRWVRPLHSILCLLDGEVIPVEFAGLTAGNVTYGHRFMAPAAITIAKPEDYEATLKKAYVIADAEARQVEILNQIQKLAIEQSVELKDDPGLLAEVTGLVEWPVVLMGRIDAQYMDLPPEVLISEMRAHQKYFALLQRPSSCGASFADAKDAGAESHAAGDPALPLRGPQDDGVFSDRFIVTANTVTQDGGKAVIAGNERVLRARLSDGRFFWDQDRKKTLSEWAKGLEGVTFHAKIGTVAQKVERIVKLAAAIADYVPGADKSQVERAAQLCKADLVTGMVGEFPELQGVMGRYYAIQQQEDDAVADAIRDHYLPLGPDSPVPRQPVSICVALADKLDTIVALSACGEEATGSKDPFSLRRSALGIIRLIIENGIRLKIKLLFEESLNIVFKTAFELKQKQEVVTLNNAADVLGEKTVDFFKTRIDLKDFQGNFNAAFKEKLRAVNELYIIFATRLKTQLKSKGISHDLISAVMANGDDDLVRVVARAEALKAFLATDDGSNLLAAYRRAGNIVAIEEKKDKRSYKGDVSPNALAQAEEQALFALLERIGPEADAKLAQEDFAGAMGSLACLRAPLDAFFDHVMVNTEDQALRVNRLGLLSRIRSTLDTVADFAKIEGG